MPEFNTEKIKENKRVDIFINPNNEILT